MMSRENRDALIKVFYERCAIGEISLDQREALIRKARTSYMMEACKKDKEEKDKEDDKKDDKKKEKEIPAKKKFEMIKKEIYKRCKDGAITEDQRDELLEKARDLCFFSEEAKAKAYEEKCAKEEKEKAKMVKESSDNEE